MKVSKIGLISTKLTKLDEQFPVQDMLLQTGQLEQYTSGIYAYGHIPYLLKKKIDSIICEVLTKYDCSELTLPILQPEKIWIESGRFEKYVSEDTMFTSKTKYGNFCLAPTAEEAVVAYARNRLKTYKQLPVTYFQIGQKFRNEIRTRGYLLRGKVFDMLDAYSFGKNQEELDYEYDQMKKAYAEIFERLGLSVQPVAADSGAIGGNVSEEYMSVSNIGEDKILFDRNSKKAFNSELLERADVNEYLLTNYGIKNTNELEEIRAVELGHIFKLGDKYAKTMNGTFIDNFGESKNYIMGCYGIGVSRTLALIYENSKIEKDGKFEGISLPKNLSPYLIYIVPKTDDEQKLTLAINLYNSLEKEGVNALFDDRSEISIGAKIKDAKVCGTPYLAVIGKSTENGIIELEETKNGRKIEIKIEDFVNYIKNL